MNCGKTIDVFNMHIIMSMKDIYVLSDSYIEILLQI